MKFSNLHCRLHKFRIAHKATVRMLANLPKAHRNDSLNSSPFCCCSDGYCCKSYLLLYCNPTLGDNLSSSIYRLLDCHPVSANNPENNSFCNNYRQLMSVRQVKSKNVIICLYYMYNSIFPPNADSFY